VKRRDWSRYREISSDPPSEYLTFGTVGHHDTSPEYARLEAGRVLVEVTLEPSGEEVIACLGTGALYTPIRYGDRVVVGLPGGTGSSPVILCRATDASQPFPAEPGGQAVATPGRVPLYAYLATQDGELLRLQTGESGDLLLRSGGSAQIRVDSADQILLSGRTHLGRGAQFSSEPVGACVGDSGAVEPGEAAGGYSPVANTNATNPPPGFGSPAGLLPADGLVRVKDAVQSNSAIDADFWNWLIGFVAVFLGWTPAMGDGGTALKLALVAYIGANPVPSQLTSLPASGSRNTCSDD
jgi:hypothetical protein